MTVTHLTNKAIAVTGLPEGARNFQVWGYRLFAYELNEKWKDIILPEGNWSILGFSQDLKEEQWKRVVEKMPWGEDNYKNYGLDPWAVQYVGKTATESGHTLLISKDLDPLLNHLILIQ